MENLPKILNNIYKKEELVMRNTFLKFVTLLAFGFSTLISGNAIAHITNNTQSDLRQQIYRQTSLTLLKSLLRQKPADLVIKVLSLTVVDDAKQVSQIEDLLVKQIDALVLIISVIQMVMHNKKS